MSNQSFFSDALTAGDGIVRLAPCWVPRSFLMPGGRLKLDPRDLYALGAHRGGIDERWFSSTTKAANGPLTAPDEGLSYIEFNGKKALLKEAIDTVGDKFLGSAVMQKHNGWNLLCKFFDNLGPIPHHLHQNDEFAARVGQKGKPGLQLKFGSLELEQGVFRAIEQTRLEVIQCQSVLCPVQICGAQVTA